MKGSAESEARKALNRLRRALEKTAHELGDVRGALESVESTDFPHAEFDAAQQHLDAIESFIDELATRARRDPYQFRRELLKDERAIKVLETAAEKSG